MLKLEGYKMKENKNWNYLMVIIVGGLSVIIGILLYTSNKQLNREIQSVTTNQSMIQQNFEIWTIEGSVEEILTQEIMPYKKRYPHINFIIKPFKNEIYKENLFNAARTNSLPDMFYTWGDEGLQELVALDVVKDITSQVNDKVKENVYPMVLNNYTTQDKIYGMPLWGWNTVVYCNTQIFEAHQVALPESYEELIAAIEVFKSHGVTPIAIGGEEPWMASLYYMMLVLDEMNVQQVQKVVEDTKYFQEEGFKHAAQRFEALITLEPWQVNYDQASQQDALLYFNQGKAAMLVGGSWMSSSLQQGVNSNVKKNIQVIPFPLESQKKYVKGVAGYADGFALNTKAYLREIDVTTLFLQLSKAVSDNGVMKRGVGIPIYKDQNLEDTDFEIMKKCQDIFPTEEYHGAYDQMLPSHLVIAYNEKLEDLIKQKITAEEFIEALVE